MSTTSRAMTFHHPVTKTLRKMKFSNSTAFYALSVILVAALLQACGGGKSSSAEASVSPENTTSPTGLPKGIIDSTYTVANTNGETGSIDSDGAVNKTNSNLGASQRETIMVLNSLKRPVLLKIVEPGDSQQPTLESTAIAFVLLHPSLALIDFDKIDLKELSSQIKSHPAFESLKSEILSDITTGSLCPIDYSCSPGSVMIANQIVGSLAIKGN
jgi:hypothetical protein